MTAPGQPPAVSAPLPDGVPLVHASRLAWRNVAGEAVVVDLRNNRMVALNESAGALWEACQQPRQVAELARATGIPEDEVVSFLSAAWELGLLVVGAGPPAPLSAIPRRSAEPPQIVWTEQLLSFAAVSCAHLPNQSPICDQVPSG